VRFLIDADLPRSLAEHCRSFGHEADDVRDLAMRSAPDPEIARRARSTGSCLITGDFGFADIRNYPPQDYHGLIVVQVPASGTSRTILTMLTPLLRDGVLLSLLPGRLAIVDPSRVRLRPPAAT
jgi:predicted nuclease of predicted toxin-antitoxin system